MSPRAIDRRVQSREWIRVLPGVYRLAAAPCSWHQLLVAAFIWGGPGAAVSHRAAVVTLQLRGLERGPCELTLPTWRPEPSPEIVLHTSDSIPPSDLVTVGCLKVTNATRTLIGLGSVVDEEALEIVLDDALRRGMTNIERLQRRLTEFGVPGRRGPGLLRRVLAERDPALGPSESVLEARFRRFLRRFALPPATPQLRVRLPDGHVARLDFAYLEKKIAIECDSYGFHSDKSTWLHDRERQNHLTSLGWQILRITWEDLTQRPEWVAMLIRAGLGRTEVSLSKSSDG